MEYKDLNNENLPIEHRVKHLEREASFVRDYVRQNQLYQIIAILALVLAIIALSK